MHKLYTVANEITVTQFSTLFYLRINCGWLLVPAIEKAGQSLFDARFFSYSPQPTIASLGVWRLPVRVRSPICLFLVAVL